MDLLCRHPTYLVVVSPPCTEFSALTRMWNEKRRTPEENARRRAIALTHLTFAMDVCAFQHAHGRGFIFEHPAAASSWKEEVVQRMLKLEHVSRIQFDMCRYGMVTPQVYRDCEPIPLRKRTSFMTNMEVVKRTFSRQFCQCKKQFMIDGVWRLHWRIQGSFQGQRLSTHAQIYPAGLCRAIGGCIAGKIKWRLLR